MRYNTVLFFIISGVHLPIVCLFFLLCNFTEKDQQEQSWILFLFLLCETLPACSQYSWLFHLHSHNEQGTFHMLPVKHTGYIRKHDGFRDKVSRAWGWQNVESEADCLFVKCLIHQENIKSGSCVFMITEHYKWQSAECPLSCLLNLSSL